MHEGRFALDSNRHFATVEQFFGISYRAAGCKLMVLVVLAVARIVAHIERGHQVRTSARQIEGVLESQ